VLLKVKCNILNFSAGEQTLKTGTLRTYWPSDLQHVLGAAGDEYGTQAKKKDWQKNIIKIHLL
jgi:hypothetical protein